MDDIDTRGSCHSKIRDFKKKILKTKSNETTIRKDFVELKDTLEYKYPKIKLNSSYLHPFKNLGKQYLKNLHLKNELKNRDEEIESLNSLFDFKCKKYDKLEEEIKRLKTELENKTQK
jgi:chromosome segregation ATPase